jgi:hypothetical protein
MTGEWLIGKDLEGSVRGLIVNLYRHLSWGTEKNHEKPQFKFFGMWTEIWTRGLRNTNQESSQSTGTSGGPGSSLKLWERSSWPRLFVISIPPGEFWENILKYATTSSFLILPNSLFAIILSCIWVTWLIINGFWIGWIDLLYLYQW